MKMLIALRQFFIPITQGGKESTNQDQTNCTSKGQFQSIVTGCLFQQKAWPMVAEGQQSTGISEIP